MENTSLDSDDVAKETENGEIPKSDVKEMISSLPRNNAWGELLTLCLYEGHWTFPDYVEGIVSARTHFQPQPSDVIICSSPKTGTTWLKSLAFAVMTRSSLDSTNPLLTKMAHDFIPLLEVDLAFPSGDREPRKIPLLATHMPYGSLPDSIKDKYSDCKLVYICRDPKDSFVSFYHFFARIMASKHADQPIITVDEAFELFCQGISWYGPYWDHVLGFWRASLEQPKKIMFLKYEEMREDTSSHVKKMAEFIGYPFSSEEEKNGMVEKVVKMCSFENLSNLEVNKNGKHREGTPVEIDNKFYFRKGKVGDWQNWLTPQMAARLDQITEQKLRGSGLTL